MLEKLAESSFLTICTLLFGFLNKANKYSVGSISNSFSFLKCSHFNPFSSTKAFFCYFIKMFIKKV